MKNHGICGDEKYTPGITKTTNFLGDAQDNPGCMGEVGINVGHGGVVDDPKLNPSKFEGFLDIGMQVLSAHGDDIPKAMFKQCAGVIIMKAKTGGAILSVSGGSGVFLAHKDGKWSNPVATEMVSGGAGFVFGYSASDVVIFVNHFAMEKFLQGQGSIDLGVDAGFAAGQVGRAAAGNIGISYKGGMASSFVYTFHKGALVSLEAVLGGRVKPPSSPNESFYGTNDVADIFDGKCETPAGNSDVPALQAKLTELENGPELAAEQ